MCLFSSRGSKETGKTNYSPVGLMEKNTNCLILTIMSHYTPCWCNNRTGVILKL